MAQTIVDLLEKPFSPEKYWMTGVLPKSSVTLIGGHAAIGKSFFINNLSRSLALGLDFLENEPGFAYGKINDRWKTPSTNGQTCRVLLIDKELGERTLQKRFTTIFQQDLDTDREKTITLLRKNLFFNSKDSGKEGEEVPSFATQRGKDKLLEICLETMPHVVILDPIGKMHHYDENSAGEIQKLYDDVEYVQSELKALETSFIITHHFGKPNRNPGIKIDELDPYNFRGSSKWFDLPDTRLMLARKPGRLLMGGWELEMGIRPRHEEEMPRVKLGMNTLGDNRVYFRQTIADRQ